MMDCDFFPFLHEGAISWVCASLIPNKEFSGISDGLWSINKYHYMSELHFSNFHYDAAALANLRSLRNVSSPTY
jgi:hypothetical protein